MTLQIVPWSADALPAPSFTLREQVRAFVEQRAPAAVAGRLSVLPPAYLTIGIETVIKPVDLSQSAAVRALVVSALQAFLHPLTGGPDGEGWSFGRAVYLSDVAAVLSALEEIDYIQTLLLLKAGSPVGDYVEVPGDRLVGCGPLRVKLTGAGS